MSRNFIISSTLVAVVAIASIGVFLYLTREVAAPSADVQSSVQQLEASEGGEDQIVFRISQDESLAEYSIYELLNGADKTVVGTTNQVAGDILVNLNDPLQSEIGEIVINARAFATDEDRRDNAVARFVLQSEEDANEFITFQPISISGLPDSVSVGDTLTFEVTGDLAVAGVTNTVIFTVTATLESEARLVGNAETIIRRADYNLTIPDVPMVANVGEEVTLKFSFVADAVSETGNS
jgi:polyisoprenoid-binding protein YceI